MINNICPLCKKRKIHKINKKVKSGEVIEYAPKKYYFKQTGWHIAKEEYWTCKKCANTSPIKGGLTAKQYNMALINLVNSGKIIL